MNRSVGIAIGAVVMIVLWMVSGQWSNGKHSAVSQQTQEDPLFSVEVEQREASATPVTVTVQGQTQPNRTAEMRARTESVVTQLNVQEGSYVQAGELLISLDLQDRPQQLEQQQALLKVAEQDYKRLSELAKKQYQSQSELDSRFADIKSAQAAIARIKLDMQHTQVRAPFSGFVQRLGIELGDLVRVGDAMVTLVETHPLVTEIQVAQHDISMVSLGQNARVELATGQQAQGKVRFISPQADPQSRTFLVELEIDNRDWALRAGVSATANIEVDSVLSHYLSPAVFSLEESGQIGVKTVNGDNTVEFYPVELLRADNSGAYVTGLPDKIQLITQGHGFVSAGVKVNPVQRKGRGQ